jgi:DnaJ-domain-containing protein 1
MSTSENKAGAERTQARSREPDIEITDADFVPHTRIEIDEQDLPPLPPPPAQTKREREFARTLGLSGRVTRDDVRRAYRELARQYHPDKVQHLGPKLREVADGEMRRINEAYAYFREHYSV